MKSWSGTHTRRFAALVLACTVAAPAIVCAQMRPDSAAEYQVKGAFLVHFIKLTEWPSSRRDGAAKLVVCVLGTSPLAPVLDTLDTAIKGRQMTVQRLTRAEDASQCEVLFISGQASGDLDSVVHNVPPGVLTVSEIDAEGPVPTVINFVDAEDGVDFDVNRKAASRARLEISSRLLSVARAVDGRMRRKD
jgi:hypothetical protein